MKKCMYERIKCIEMYAQLIDRFSLFVENLWIVYKKLARLINFSLFDWLIYSSLAHSLNKSMKNNEFGNGNAWERSKEN